MTMKFISKKKLKKLDLSEKLECYDVAVGNSGRFNTFNEGANITYSFGKDINLNLIRISLGCYEVDKMDSDNSQYFGVEDLEDLKAFCDFAIKKLKKAKTKQNESI